MNEIVKLRKEAEAEMIRLRDFYRVDEREDDPEYVVRALDAVLGAQTLVEGEELKQKAIKKMELFCLVMMAKGKAKGQALPETPRVLEQRANEAERFAALAVRNGSAKSQEKQLKKAEELRRRAAQLRSKRM